MVSKRAATGNATKSGESAKPAPARRPAVTTQSASDVIKTGNRRASLEALRDVLADRVVVAEPNVIAQIAGRLQAVMAEIDRLPEAKKVTKADDLANRRKARRAAAQAVASATGQGQ